MGANFTISKEAKAAIKEYNKKQPKSNREEDHRTEQIVCDFLMDAYFKKKNNAAKLITSYDLQISGVDVQMPKNGITSNIDVKAQASQKYINNPTDTFVLELDFINSVGYRQTGWFLNDDLLTDYYSFVWVLESDVDDKNKIHSKYDLGKVQVMTVDKAKLAEYTDEKFGNLDIDEVVNEMRTNEEKYRYLAPGIHFSHSPHLREKPVNLVVKKWVFEKFAIAYDTVTLDTIERMPGFKPMTQNHSKGTIR